MASPQAADQKDPEVHPEQQELLHCAPAPPRRWAPWRLAVGVVASLLVLGAAAAIFAPAAEQGAPEGKIEASGIISDKAIKKRVALIFSTQTGKTEQVAQLIGQHTGLQATNIGDIQVEDLAGYDGIIIGAPTYNTAEPKFRSGTYMDDALETIRELSLSGKPVAVFGLGDAGVYPEYFCDAIEEIHGSFKQAGAKMIGYEDAKFTKSAHRYMESKSVVGGKFLGLALDNDGGEELTKPRVTDWLDQIRDEGMPL